MWLYTPALTQRHIYLDTLLAITKLKSNLKKKKKNKQANQTNNFSMRPSIQGTVQPSFKQSQLWAATDWSRGISWWRALNSCGENDAPLPLQLPASTCTVPGSERRRFKLTEEWSGNEKEYFYTGSLVARTRAKGRQLKGTCVGGSGSGSTLFSSNPAKSTGCWLYTLVLPT